MKITEVEPILLTVDMPEEHPLRWSGGEAASVNCALVRVDLTVWSANERGYHLYTSMGYREIGRFPDWIRSDLTPGGTSDLVWMLKDL